MRPRVVQLDFARAPGLPRRPGTALGIAGIALLLLSSVLARDLVAQREGLESRLDALRTAAAAAGKVQRGAKKSAPERDAGFVELVVPWSALLSELEAASRDSAGRIALLGLEPDRVKRRVRITAQARTLEDALAYVKRLATIDVVRTPMLDSHEVRVDDPEHPIQFQVSADWSAAL
ncbi:MAG: hypothetical protein HY749_14850 [Gammaproteobacteria bacterium]|nr:hypothetical protein [Gammaproteobacteria bacterium]MBI5614884.1 hypothetical protein [Gammaproteobacteria bacterium]